MIILVLLIGFAVYFMVTNHPNHDFRSKTDSDAVEILKSRYVNGEVDDETYKKMLVLIRK